MGWLKALFVFALLTSLGYAGGQASGLCTYSTDSGGMASAQCRFPSCPVGVDCQPPTIDTGSAAIQYEEPLIQWKTVCPDASITGPCWEVHVPFAFQASATDDNGVQQIGVHLATEVSAQRTFTQYWGDVTHQAGPRYTISGEILAHVPPGQRLDIAVYELCAKDNDGNEGCVLPAHAQGLNFSLNH